jgi:type 2 lantibiotic biosynthesis protein LanM
VTASKVEAIRIADRAASFWERLRHREDSQRCSDEVPERTERRLDRWRHVVARGDPLAFQRRLAWDNLTLPGVQAALACAEASAPSSPQWREVFVDLIQSVEHSRLHPPATIARNRDQPRPFEDVVLPLVYAARRRLHRTMQCPDSAELPGGLLSDRAYMSLELGLLDRLCRVCAESLQSDFSSFRPVGHSLLNALVGATGTTSTRHYDAFVGHLLSANLMPMFEKYPVLARLAVVIVENWVAYCAEFQSHLRRDLPLIEKCFQVASDGSLGEVVQLRFALSDFHRHGRCVMALTFSCGLKLAYKPKPLGIDRAFNQLIHWCNQQGLTPDLKTVRVLDRPGHGWMEWVDQQPCADDGEARRFYRRAGMLLGLLHVLRCTDCHHENLIAHGGHLILVDGETLMVPDLETTGGALLPASNESFWQSVVRTGMLPHWETRLDTSIPCDVSALGGVERQPNPIQVPQWKSINTDDMDVYYGSITLPRYSNAAMLNGVILSPGDHVDDLVHGFAEMYRLLLRQRTALLAAEGLLSLFRTQSVRYVFRPTEQYGQILRRSLAPEPLQNGCDRSIELDHLSRGFVAEGQPTKAWALLEVERKALEGLDIPRFDVQADETTLRNGGQAIAPHFFDASGYSKVVERLESLSEADLALQIRIIEASFHAWRARSEKHVDSDIGHAEPSDGASHAVTESERRRRFLIRANAIAEGIASSAVCNPDGSFSWIGLAHLPKIGRYQVLPVDEGLYGGRCGIALFLAACDQVNRSHAYRPVVLGALQPLRALLRNRDHFPLEQYVRTVGIGVAEGIGGLVYALTCIAGWWQDPALQDEAEMLARAISPEALQADRQFDVIGGAAGAILGLMKLYRVRPSSDLLRIVQDCAEWLCRNQHSGGEYAGAWETSSTSRPLTGFSHGASGIANALTQLYSVTRETQLLAAVQAAVEFEHTAFLPNAGNWIDFRRHEPGIPPSSVASWCHGAPGIGLARLALISELQHPLLFPDLETALATTQLPRLHTVDHLCCGSFGRFEILLHAARILGRRALSVAAAEQAWDILCRSDAFRVPPCDVPEARNPGFFDGLAGIGYVLLRLVAPDDLPCVLAWE